MTALLDAVWFVARWACIVGIPIIGLTVLVLAVKESLREYRHARQLDAAYALLFAEATREWESLR